MVGGHTEDGARDRGREQAKQAMGVAQVSGGGPSRIQAALSIH